MKKVRILDKGWRKQISEFMESTDYVFDEVDAELEKERSNQNEQSEIVNGKKENGKTSN